LTLKFNWGLCNPVRNKDDGFLVKAYWWLCWTRNTRNKWHYGYSKSGSNIDMHLEIDSEDLLRMKHNHKKMSSIVSLWTFHSYIAAPAYEVYIISQNLWVLSVVKLTSSLRKLINLYGISVLQVHSTYANIKKNIYRKVKKIVGIGWIG
jgi:hypothetical protein